MQVATYGSDSDALLCMCGLWFFKLCLNPKHIPKILAPKPLLSHKTNYLVERGGRNKPFTPSQFPAFFRPVSGTITMADFTETSISRNAKRVFTDPIADVETFNTVVEAFKNDETMNIIKEVSSATYKTKIAYKDAAGEDAGYALFYGVSTDNMNDMASLLAGTEASETAAGVGASAAIDEEAYHWLVKFSCTKNINIEGKNYEDTFTVTIGQDYMLISGFTYDATRDSIETWADAQAALA